MSERPIPPIFLLNFFLAHSDLFARLLQSKPSTIQDQILATKRLPNALPPTFEGAEGPVEEGMVYLLFNSRGNSSKIQDLDSVYRLFWVVAPEINYHQIDAFLISTHLQTQHWVRYFYTPVIQQSPTHWHQEAHIAPLEMVMHGDWKTQYDLQFHDRIINLQGTLQYTPIDPQATLTYYNGRELSTPSLIQKFYDSFGLHVTGSISHDNHAIEVVNGRGLIEHGIGIFSTLSFRQWKWLNLHFAEGAIHLFSHPLEAGKGKTILAGEGAAVINQQWYHFLTGEFEVIEQTYIPDTTIQSQIPSSWKVTIKSSDPQIPKVELSITRLAHYAWRVGLQGIGKYYIDYLLKATGTWNNIPLEGIGTMEYLMPSQ